MHGPWGALRHVRPRRFIAFALIGWPKKSAEAINATTALFFLFIYHHVFISFASFISLFGNSPIGLVLVLLVSFYCLVLFTCHTFASSSIFEHLLTSSSIFKNEPGSNLSWSSSQSRASNLNVWAAFDIDSILLVKVNQVEKMAKTEANAIERMKMASVQFIETRFNHSINFNRVLFASCSLPFISVYCRSDCTEATGIR